MGRHGREEQPTSWWSASRDERNGKEPGKDTALPDTLYLNDTLSPTSHHSGIAIISRSNQESDLLIRPLGQIPHNAFLSGDVLTDTHRCGLYELSKHWFQSSPVDKDSLSSQRSLFISECMMRT